MDAQQRPRMHFKEVAHPPSVTFDDGERIVLNLPWAHFRCAEWDHVDPTVIRIEIGNWQVFICGHNLAPLFDLIGRAQLARVRAHPEFADDLPHENDVFATSIRLLPLASTSPE